MTGILDRTKEDTTFTAANNLCRSRTSTHPIARQDERCKRSGASLALRKSSAVYSRKTMMRSRLVAPDGTFIAPTRRLDRSVPRAVFATLGYPEIGFQILACMTRRHTAAPRLAAYPASQRQKSEMTSSLDPCRPRRPRSRSPSQLHPATHLPARRESHDGSTSATRIPTRPPALPSSPVASREGRPRPCLQHSPTGRCRAARGPSDTPFAAASGRTRFARPVRGGRKDSSLPPTERRPRRRRHPGRCPARPGRAKIPDCELLVSPASFSHCSSSTPVLRMSRRLTWPCRSHLPRCHSGKYP